MDSQIERNVIINELENFRDSIFKASAAHGLLKAAAFNGHELDACEVLSFIEITDGYICRTGNDIDNLIKKIQKDHNS